MHKQTNGRRSCHLLEKVGCAPSCMSHPMGLWKDPEKQVVELLRDLEAGAARWTMRMATR